MLYQLVEAIREIAKLLGPFIPESARNIRNMQNKINKYKEGKVQEDKFNQIYQGWMAYVKQANNFKC